MFSIDRYILQILDTDTMFDVQFRQVHNLFRIQFRLPVTDLCCGFESWSGQGVQHYMVKFVSDLRQVSGFLRVLQFPPPIKLAAII
jgi:hypothetical protein